MILIDDDSSLPSDPGTRVDLREQVGLENLDRLDFSCFRREVPPEQTLIQVQTDTASCFTLWFIGEDAGGMVAVVVHSDQYELLRKHRVACYERLDSHQERRLSSKGIQAGDALRFTFADDRGMAQTIVTSPVRGRGIRLLIGVDVTLFRQAHDSFASQLLSGDRGSFSDTICRELESLPEEEAQAISRLIRALDPEAQVRLRQILQQAATNNRLVVVLAQLERHRDKLRGSSLVSESIFGILQRMARRE